MVEQTVLMVVMRLMAAVSSSYKLPQHYVDNNMCSIHVLVPSTCMWMFELQTLKLC